MAVPCPVDNTFIVILVHSFSVVRLGVVCIYGNGDLRKLQRCTRIQTLHLWTTEILLTELLDTVGAHFLKNGKDVIPYPVCRRVYEALLKGDNGND